MKNTGILLLLLLAFSLITACKKDDSEQTVYPFEHLDLPAGYEFEEILEPLNGDMIWRTAGGKIHFLKDGIPVYYSDVDTTKIYVDAGMVDGNTVYFLEILNQKSVYYQYDWNTRKLSFQEDLPLCTQVFFSSKHKRYLLRNKPNVLGSWAELYVPDGTGYKKYAVPGSNDVAVFPSNYVYDLVEGAQDTIWAVTAKSGAFGFANDTFAHCSAPVLASLQGFFIAPPNTKWAYQEGLWHTSPTGAGWQSVELINGSFGRFFLQMKQDANFDTWIIFNNEILRYSSDGSQKLFKDLIDRGSTQSPFYDTRRWHLDRSGYHWIQTVNQGVYRAKSL